MDQKTLIEKLVNVVKDNMKEVHISRHVIQYLREGFMKVLNHEKEKDMSEDEKRDRELDWFECEEMNTSTGEKRKYVTSAKRGEEPYWSMMSGFDKLLSCNKISYEKACELTGMKDLYKKDE